MKRKIISAVICTALLCGLCSCNGGAEKQSAEIETTETATAKAVESGMHETAADTAYNIDFDNAVSNIIAAGIEADGSEFILSRTEETDGAAYYIIIKGYDSGDAVSTEEIFRVNVSDGSVYLYVDPTLPMSDNQIRFAGKSDENDPQSRYILIYDGEKAVAPKSETAEIDGGEVVPPDGDFLLEMFDIWWREDVLENGKSVALWASPAGSAKVFYTDIDGDGEKELCFIIDTFHGSNLYVCDYADNNWKVVDALAIGNYTYLQTDGDGTTSLFVVRATRSVEGLDCYVYKNGVEEKFDILDEDKLYEELFKIDGMNEQEEFFHAQIQKALEKYDNLTNFYDLPYVYTAMLYDFRGLIDEEHRMAGFDEEQTRKEFDEFIAEVAGLFKQETTETAGLTVSPSGYVLDPGVTLGEENAWDFPEGKPCFIGEPAEGVRFYGVNGGEEKEYTYYTPNFGEDVYDQYVIIERDGIADEFPCPWSERFGTAMSVYAGDFDGDGETEFASSRYSLGGTSCSVNELTLYKLTDGHYRRFWFDEAAFVGKYITCEVDTEKEIVTFSAESFGKTFSYDFSEDMPNGGCNVIFGMINNVEFDGDEIVYTATPWLSGSGMCTKVSVIFRVKFSEGEFVCTGVEFNGSEI